MTIIKTANKVYATDNTMSETVCFRYFPAECNNMFILPFLSMDAEIEGVDSQKFPNSYREIFEKTCSVKVDDYYVYYKGAEHNLTPFVPAIMAWYIKDPTAYGSPLEPDRDKIFVVQIV